jgi:hypothetical protein
MIGIGERMSGFRNRLIAIKYKMRKEPMTAQVKVKTVDGKLKRLK